MEINPYEIAKEQLGIVAKEINLDPNIHERLKYCQRILTVSIPIIMDDGSLLIYEGHIVHHLTIIGQ